MKFVHRMLANQNRATTMWTVDLLEPQPDDPILEIGFGPGLGIAAAAMQVPNGSVVGWMCASAMRITWLFLILNSTGSSR